MSARLDEELTRVLGARTAKSLEALGLTTVGDLLRHYPRRYGTPGELTDIGALTSGDFVTVMAEVRSATVRRMRNRDGALLEAVVTDGRSHLSLTFFAKRAGVLRMHEDKLRPGRVGLFTGTVGEYRGTRQLAHPDYIVVGVDAGTEEEAMLEASKPIPIYPASAKAPTWRIARAVRTVLDPLTAADLPDPVPEALRQRHGLLGALEALRAAHVPDTDADWKAARSRLRYEEALVLQTALAQRRAAATSQPAQSWPARTGGLVAALDQRLPYDLTAGQRAVGEDISAALASTVPMQRLLQGDVGAGKTVVALRAMLQVVDGGGQAALLAPTEVLAAQHLRSLEQLMGELAHGGMLTASDAATRIVLVTGSQGSAQRRAALAEAASGAAGIVVGTHALLSETVQFANLGLVVVDEQHRFGVDQRDALRERVVAGSGTAPHTLVMTATPIPRTVAMTVFGDLEVSTLSERPVGRAEVVTHVVPADNDAWMERVWARVREEVDQGRRAYVVCARIDGDDAGDSADASDASAADEAEAAGGRPALNAVADVAAQLEGHPALTGVAIGTLHGRMRPEDKETAMTAFAAGSVPVLVSTTVIEVGVDVPEASVMVVLDADNFGISQLHQLRGRIGRGGLPGVCLLVSRAAEDSPAAERLGALAATTDGFALAEKDLELRREGDVLGASQAGGRNSLRLLRVVRDADVIAQARADAAEVAAEDPTLAHHGALADAIGEWLGPAEREYLARY